MLITWLALQTCWAELQVKIQIRVLLRKLKMQQALLKEIVYLHFTPRNFNEETLVSLLKFRLRSERVPRIYFQDIITLKIYLSHIIAYSKAFNLRLIILLEEETSYIKGNPLK